jgi:lysophospholipase L1-like esterase
MLKRLTFSILLILVIIIAVVISSHHSKMTARLEPLKSYVAMGDSIAAGVGLDTYSDSSACDRTNQSYPDLVAKSLNLKLDSLACSGATIRAGIIGSQDVNDLNVAPQLNALFKRPKPYLVTLTIGANDVNWTSFIQKCYVGTCGTQQDTANVDSLLNQLSNNLQNTLSKIKSHYVGDPPRVIVTGYHQVLPTGGLTCSDTTGISQTEMTWARQQQSKLNSTINSVVNEFSYAKFASINFSGHELCTSDSWVQGISDSNPYHPTDAGQESFAKSVISTIRLFK